MNHGGGAELTGVFGTVIAAHTRVIPAESYSALDTDVDRQREIALLQQKALWLEREIAERTHAEEQLKLALASEQAARRETEEALRLRDEFLSIAAHELKTPLTGLSGHVQLTQRLLNLNTDGHVAGERTLRSLNVIGAQTRKLALLLDQLLDTSRLEAGRLAIEPQPVDLAALAQEVAATTRLVTNRHSIIVTTPLELSAQADPLRLEQVLLNLLDNALRHSPDGGRIDVTLARQASGAIELTVQDQGPGIPAENRERVF
ncbi:MAG TPA: ATP-binding protein, partial [Thermomicrobiales bacterium]|nr:ATP-binding protein [Thermomicrobiales bacterium]